MRFSFDLRKSKRGRDNPRRGIELEEAQELCNKSYWLDQRCDLPKQYLAIGWVGSRIYFVIFEFRSDEGENDTRFLKGQGRMVQPIQRVNLDITIGMLKELDQAAVDLNISRQAIIIWSAMKRAGMKRRSIALEPESPAASS